MEEIFSYIMLFIYPASAIYFTVITKKLFKISKRKMIPVFLIAPSIIGFLAMALTAAIAIGDTTLSETILSVVLGTLGSLVLQMMLMAAYVKTVQPKNPSIAVFIYLCSAMLVPGVLILIGTQSATSGYIPVIAYIFMHILLYRIVVIPLSALTDEKQVTSMRFFLIIPIMTFVFNTLMYTLYIAATYSIDHTVMASDGIGDFLRSDERGEKVLNLLTEWRGMLETQTTSFVYPSLFTLLVLIVSAAVVVRNIAYMNETIRANKEVKALSVEIMEALAHTIDAKDEYTRGHSVRVAKYSRMLAVKMGLSEKECEDVYYMGLLHDLGKIGVPNAIINSPAKLTPEEYDVVKGHPVLGAEILSEIKSRPDLMIGARWHHERYDGNGYPDGKAGEDIPLFARIIAVADSYDAMTSNRSYRKHMTQEAVRAEIEKNMETQFDAEIAKYMLEIIDEDVNYELHE